MSVNAIDVRKAQGYAVLASPADGVGLRKAVGYAVLNTLAEIGVRKAVGYVILHDGAVVTSALRRRRVTIST
jgi:hypothetical protein